MLSATGCLRVKRRELVNWANRSSPPYPGLRDTHADRPALGQPGWERERAIGDVRCNAVVVMSVSAVVVVIISAVVLD